MKKLLIPAALIILAHSALWAGLKVTPARQDLVVDAGQSYEGDYRVTNEYDEPLIVQTESRDWYRAPGSIMTPCAQWLSLFPAEIPLKPGETGTFHYRVQMPASAQGTQFAMVSFAPLMEQEQSVSLVVSAALFVTVRGTEIIDWELADAKIQRQDALCQVSVSVKNKGNTHLRPKGRAVVSSGKKEIFSFDLKESRPVYPGSERVMVGTTDVTQFPGKGKYSIMITITDRGITKSYTISCSMDNKGSIIQQ